jgi:hypothetical protein
MQEISQHFSHRSEMDLNIHLVYQYLKYQLTLISDKKSIKTALIVLHFDESQLELDDETE